MVQVGPNGGMSIAFSGVRDWTSCIRQEFPRGCIRAVIVLHFSYIINVSIVVLMLQNLTIPRYRHVASSSTPCNETKSNKRLEYRSQSTAPIYQCNSTKSIKIPYFRTCSVMYIPSRATIIDIGYIPTRLFSLSNVI